MASFARLLYPGPIRTGSLSCAEISLQIFKDNGIGDFDLAFAYEALASASAVAGNRTDRAKYHKKVVDAADGIREKDDRAFLLKDLKTI